MVFLRIYFQNTRVPTMKECRTQVRANRAICRTRRRVSVPNGQLVYIRQDIPGAKLEKTILLRTHLMDINMIEARTGI